MKRKKVKLILVLTFILIVFFTGLNIFVSYFNIKRSVVDTITNQSLESAKSIAASMDVELYEQFLDDPVKNKSYWETAKYLNDAKNKIGALYVYTLKIDNERTSESMVVGVPEEESGKYNIDEISSVPEKQVKRAYEGKIFSTGLIEDPIYGEYITVGAPIKNKVGKTIGYIGVDISTDTLNQVGRKVLKNSFYVLMFNGVFVIILFLSFFTIQKWYQKELKKEVGDTEDTYQAEFRSLISSVQSLRHDFTNHIQVVHGLLRLGNQVQALDYLTSLFKEVKSIESMKLNINNPGLSVLLETKKLSAENHNIDVRFTIPDNLFDRMKTIDLIKLLSNLIDNAIEAAIELPDNDRRIRIACIVDPKYDVWEITNTGPRVSDKEKEYIFKSGYSTKKQKPGKVRGQGLFIVKDIVSRYDGELTFNSLDSETKVTVKIPK